MGWVEKSTYNGSALDDWSGRQVWQDWCEIIETSFGFGGKRGDVWDTGNVRALRSGRCLSGLHRWRGQSITLLTLIVFGKTSDEGRFSPCTRSVFE